MSISGISGNMPKIMTQSVSSTQKLESSTTLSQANDAKGTGFSEKIGQAVKELNEAQNQAIKSAISFENGQETNLASVMVDQQVASLGFQMALNVRNKALGAYRDIMNMPV